MKIKKLLSTFAALAIAASSFAGLGITANAAALDYTADWSALTAENKLTATTAVGSTGFGTNWGFLVQKGAGNVTPENSTLKLYTQSDTNTYLYYKFGNVTDVEGKVYKLTFDYSTDSNGTSNIMGYSADEFTHYSAVNNWTTGVDLGISDNATYSVSVVCDNPNDKLIYTVGDTEKVVDLSKTITGIAFRATKYKTDTISNVKAYTLDMPTMTLTEPTTMDIAEESTTKTTSVTATLSEETAITAVSSSDTEVATVAFDGTTVTVTGVDIGTATISVTAAKNGENADVSETITKTFDVEVKNSDAKLTAVTVNYYNAADKTIVVKTDKTTFAEIAVGTSIALEDIDTTTFLSNGNRYVYDVSNESNTTLPYMVVDGDNVINLYFTEEVAAVSGYATYKAGNVVIGGADIDVSGLYVNDTVKYAYPKYVIKDSVLYSRGADYTATATVGSDATVSVDVEYSAANITGTPEYFYDFNDATIYNDAGQYTAKYASGGSANGANTLIAADMLRDGVYTIEIANCRNRKANIFVGDTQIGNLSTGANAAMFATSTFTNVIVKDGAAVTATANTDVSSAIDTIDYVLAIRTGDIPPSIASVTSVTTTDVAPIADTINVAGKEETASYADLTAGKTVTTIYVKVDNTANGGKVAPTVVVDINGTEETAVATEYTSPNADGTFVYQIVADAEATIKSVTYGAYDTYEPADDSADADDSTDDTTTDSEGTEADA